MRLAKYLATAGIASRRAAEDLIRAGRVTVAGATVSDPAAGTGPAHGHRHAHRRTRSGVHRRHGEAEDPSGAVCRGCLRWQWQAVEQLLDGFPSYACTSAD